MGGVLRYLLLVGAVLVGSVMSTRAQVLPKRVYFEGFAKVSHISTSGMNLWVTINNESIWRYEVKSCEVDIAIDGSHVATISLRDKVVIPRRECGDILLPLRFESQSSFAVGRLLWRVMHGESDRITLSYRMRAGLRVISLRYKGQDIRLSDVIASRVGMVDAIEELWQMVK